MQDFISSTVGSPVVFFLHPCFVWGSLIKTKQEKDGLLIGVLLGNLASAPRQGRRVRIQSWAAGGYEFG